MEKHLKKKKRERKFTFSRVLRNINKRVFMIKNKYPCQEGYTTVIQELRGQKEGQQPTKTNVGIYSSRLWRPAMPSRAFMPKLKEEKIQNNYQQLARAIWSINWTLHYIQKCCTITLHAAAPSKISVSLGTTKATQNSMQQNITPVNEIHPNVNYYSTGLYSTCL